MKQAAGNLIAAVALAAAVLGAAPDARADFSPESIQLWQQLALSGSPTLPDPMPRVQDYLKYDHQRCGSYVDQVVKETLQFAEHASKSSRSADSDMKDIQNLLFKELGTAHRCFGDVAAAYLLGSVTASDPYYLMFVETAKDKEAAKKAYVPDSPAVFILTASLLNQGKIRILTPELRKELGPEWSRPAAQTYPLASPFALRGAYACANSTIYIDPQTTPINLSANLFHEIDHLIRDKETPFAPGSPVDWKQQLLLDETLALSAGVQHELALTAWKGKHNGTLSEVAKAFGANPSLFTYSAYSIKDDRNLFSEGGPYQRLWKKQMLGDGQSLSVFLARTFFRDCRMNTCMSDTISDLSEIYQAVDQVYFPNAPLASEMLNALLPQNLKFHPRGLSNWLDEEATWKIEGKLLTPDDPDQEWELHGNFGAILRNGNGPYSYIDWIQGGDPNRYWGPGFKAWPANRVALPMLGLLKTLQNFESWMQAPSEMCNALIQNHSDPNIQSYIGSSLSVDGGPSHPGGESGAKGDEPVRACYLLSE